MIQQSHFWVYIQRKLKQDNEKICALSFITTFFTRAKTWKQPKCLSTDEWIKKMWHIYTMEYYSAIKKKKLSYL